DHEGNDRDVNDLALPHLTDFIRTNLARATSKPLVEPLGDVMATPPPDAASVIPGVLLCRSGVMFAPGAERKSTSATLMAAHVVLGVPFGGRAIERAGKVLYVTGEDEPDDIRRAIWYMEQAGAFPSVDIARLQTGLLILDANAAPGLPRLVTRDRD